MKFWQTLLRRDQEIARYSVDQYLADLSVAFNGSRYALSGGSTGWAKTEDIEQSFTGYVSSFYKSNGIVFAIVLARLMLFTEARFCWWDVGDNGEDGKPAGRSGLEVLERPWPNAGTGELLARMEQDVSLAGNFYAAREASRLRRLRPDWVTIVLTAPPAEATESDVAGYWYHPGRTYANAAEPQGGDQVYLPDEVAHFAPIPDPEAQYRGMSWLTPVVREVSGDKAATEHKLNFFTNGATMGQIISARENLTDVQFQQWKSNILEQTQGSYNAYRPLFLASPIDTTITTANMQQLDFKVSQGAGETRLCAAGGVPPIIVGLSEGLASATYSNYGMARRKFGDHWGRPQWKFAAVALSNVVESPGPDLRLGVNVKDIAFLREDRKDQVEITKTQILALEAGIRAGYKPDPLVDAIEADDISLLKGQHTGLTSVQLLPPGTKDSDGDGKADTTVQDEAAEDEAAAAYEAELQTLRSQFLLDTESDEADDIERRRAYHGDSPGERIPAGHKGGGRFKKLSDRITDALKDFLNGEGDGDPLEGFNREQLRKAAKDLGVTPRRGASAEEIKLQLLTHARGGKAAPEGEKPDVKEGTSAKPRESVLGGPMDEYEEALHALSAADIKKVAEEMNIPSPVQSRWPAGKEARIRYLLTTIDDNRRRNSRAFGRHDIPRMIESLGLGPDQKATPKNAPEPDRSPLTPDDELDDFTTGALADLARENGIAAPHNPLEGDRTEILAKLRAAGITRLPEDPKPREATPEEKAAEEEYLMKVLREGGFTETNTMTGEAGRRNRALRELRARGLIRREKGFLVVTPAGRAEMAKSAPKTDRSPLTPDDKALTGADALSSDPAVRAVQVENRIRAAYRRLIDDPTRMERLREQIINETGLTPIPGYAGLTGAPDWVGLADIRDELGESVSRDELDAVLKKMATIDTVAVPIADQKILLQRDRDSAVQIGGQTKHAIHLDDPSPRPLPVAKSAPKTDRTPLSPDDKAHHILIDDDLSTNQKRRRLKALGLAQEDIDRLAPTASMVAKAAAKKDAPVKKATPSPRATKTRPSYLDDENSLLLDKFAESLGTNVKQYMAPFNDKMPLVNAPMEEQFPYSFALYEVADGLTNATMSQANAVKALRDLADFARRMAAIPDADLFPTKQAAAQKLQGPGVAEAADKVADALEGMTLPKRKRRPTISGITQGSEGQEIDESRFSESKMFDHRTKGPDGIIRHRGEGVPLDFAHPASGTGIFLSTRTKLRPGLSDDENRSLDLYTLSAIADPLNTSLRQGRTEHGTVDLSKIGEVGSADLNEVAAHLDRAISESELTEDAVLYRGSMMRPVDIRQLTPGAIYTEAGYLSTATTRRAAQRIVNWRETSGARGRKPVIFRILAPQGTHAALGHESADEALLGRGRRMRVVRSETQAGTMVVVMELLPEA